MPLKNIGKIMSGIKHVQTPFSYSSVVVADDYAFLSLHRGFGQRFEEQFNGAVLELKKTLEGIDLPLSSIVKVTVWLKNINDLPMMEKLFLQYFESDQCPARMTATTEFIDADCLVMIEGTAFCGQL
ncbi:RidA family protein [Vibrio sp. PP-XX7]